MLYHLVYFLSMISQFGHSAEQASMFAMMNFNGFFFGRIDYQDFIARKANKTLEYIWRGSPTLGKSTEIFAGVFFTSDTGVHLFFFSSFCLPLPFRLLLLS
jgi:lysosomal alpha-mannosidase